MNKQKVNELIQKALEVRRNSYAPYSWFQVGAALLTSSGKVYLGTNIENSSYPVGICAERSAFAQAISNGERSFEMLAIVGGKIDEYPLESYCAPCGMCRQFMNEFCDPNFLVIIAKSEIDYLIFALDELLPNAFHLL